GWGGRARAGPSPACARAAAGPLRGRLRAAWVRWERGGPLALGGAAGSGLALGGAAGSGLALGGAAGSGLALGGAAGSGLARRGAAAPPARAPAARPAATGQAGLFEPADPAFPSPRDALDALVAVQADQLRRIAADDHPGRFALLTAAESAAGLVAAEMGHYGLPWRADVHAALLASLLGDKPVPGLRPQRLADLA